ncbi:hypothetical protein TCON_1718 [Astathelohania contejeani]|uniref:Uncharacterized protein n=1 Tax=Astathelohania contejeani TaxID=164912 RepID=A0ABQ7HY07_9MICR|nr:hypothetical protein TCON_1718 [Thelohania contejeani]
MAELTENMKNLFRRIKTWLSASEIEDSTSKRELVDDHVEARKKMRTAESDKIINNYNTLIKQFSDLGENTIQLECLDVLKSNLKKIVPEEMAEDVNMYTEVLKKVIREGENSVFTGEIEEAEEFLVRRFGRKSYNSFIRKAYKRILEAKRGHRVSYGILTPKYSDPKNIPGDIMARVRRGEWKIDKSIPSLVFGDIPTDEEEEYFSRTNISNIISDESESEELIEKCNFNDGKPYNCRKCIEKDIRMEFAKKEEELKSKELRFISDILNKEEELKWEYERRKRKEENIEDDGSKKQKVEAVINPNYGDTKINRNDITLTQGNKEGTFLIQEEKKTSPFVQVETKEIPSLFTTNEINMPVNQPPIKETDIFVKEPSLEATKEFNMPVKEESSSLFTPKEINMPAKNIFLNDNSSNYSQDSFINTNIKKEEDNSNTKPQTFGLPSFETNSSSISTSFNYFPTNTAFTPLSNAAISHPTPEKNGMNEYGGIAFNSNSSHSPVQPPIFTPMQTQTVESSTIQSDQPSILEFNTSKSLKDSIQKEQSPLLKVENNVLGMSTTWTPILDGKKGTDDNQHMFSGDISNIPPNVNPLTNITPVLLNNEDKQKIDFNASPSTAVKRKIFRPKK